MQPCHSAFFCPLRTTSHDRTCVSAGALCKIVSYHEFVMRINGQNAILSRKDIYARKRVVDIPLKLFGQTSRTWTEFYPPEAEAALSSQISLLPSIFLSILGELEIWWEYVKYGGERSMKNVQGRFSACLRWSSASENNIEVLEHPIFTGKVVFIGRAEKEELCKKSSSQLKCQSFRWSRSEKRNFLILPFFGKKAQLE